MILSALTDIRRDQSVDSRQTRAELMAAFNRAHDDNKQRMDLIASALREAFNRAHDENKQRMATLETAMAHQSKELGEHNKRDDERFNALNRVSYMAAGGLALLMILLQAWGAIATFLS